MAPDIKDAAQAFNRSAGKRHIGYAEIFNANELGDRLIGLIKARLKKLGAACTVTHDQKMKEYAKTMKYLERTQQ